LADTESDILSESVLLEEIRARYTAARDHARDWRTEARDTFNMYSGNQWSEDDKNKLIEQGRVPVTFNRISVYVDAVIGYEVNNRQETRYIPRTPGDAKVNEMLTEAANYFRDQCDAEFEESDAFRDMIISGMGWTNDRLSDEQNPDFDLVRDRVDPLSMLWDPSARKPNLADSRYVFYETTYSQDEAKALVPEWDGQYIAADWLTDSLDDSNPGHNNPRMDYKGQGESTSAVRDVKVLEYQYCEDKLEHVLQHPTGPSITLSDEEWEQLDDKVREKFEQEGIKHTTRRKREWKRYFLIGASPFEKKHPYPEGPTYHCITGKRDRNTGHWFGIVRSMTDPQRWSNKFMSQIMHLINSSAKPGYDVEKGAIENINKFITDSAKPGAVNVFVDGAISKNRVQYRQATGLPPDLSNLLQYSNDAHSDVSGVNAELLGMADREQAGVLEYQRKQSAVTLLAPLFDSFRRYRKIAGRCWLYFMQNYLTDGRLVRIVMDEQQELQVPFQNGEVPNPSFDPQQAQEMQAAGQEPPPAVLQFFDAQTSEYDVIVDQSASSPNLKEATWMALQPLIEVFMQMGDPNLIALLLEYSPAPESFMEKFRDIQTQAAQQPPPPDPEMMKVEAQIEGKKAEIQLKQESQQVEFQMEQARAQQDMQLEVIRLQNELQIAKIKAENEIQIARMKAQMQAQIDREKANAQVTLMYAQADAEEQRADQQFEAENQRTDYKTEAEVKRLDKMATAKAKAAKKAKPAV